MTWASVIRSSMPKAKANMQLNGRWKEVVVPSPWAAINCWAVGVFRAETEAEEGETQIAPPLWWGDL
jgi:hypothetical protein